MPIYSTVYPLRPINKTAAKGCSGLPSLEKVVRQPIKKEVKPIDWSKEGVPPKISYEELVARNKAVIEGKERSIGMRTSDRKVKVFKPREEARQWEVRWGRLWQWVKKESLFIARNKLSRDDKVYQFVVAMKLNGLKPMKVRLVQTGNLWRLVSASSKAGVNSLTQLANRLNCSLKVEGPRDEMMKQLKELELLFRNYELIGWSEERK